MIEAKIDALTAAINRLADTLGQQLAMPAPDTKVKAEPEKKAPVKKMAKKKAAPKDEVIEKIAEELVKEEAPVVEDLDIPSVEEAQKALGSIAQKYGPVMIIAGIKHYGEGRLSDLDDATRLELVTTITALEIRLDAEPDLVNQFPPDQLYAQTLGE